ncbi:MAG: helix-turn-helix transcriptional regulator [Bacteroidales bacterium]
MISRIILILKTQNLSSSQFADEIGVQRSSISHILSGRNNPSLEFVMKVLKRFPDINSDWIISGKGSMYRGRDSKTEVEFKEINKIGLQPNLFNFDEPEQPLIEPLKVDDLYEVPKYEKHIEEKNAENTNNIIDILTVNPEKTEEKNGIKSDKKDYIEEKSLEINKMNKRIEKVLFFYSDKTFKEYFPE